MAEEIDKIARIFMLLESIHFVQMRNEFESIPSWKRIAAGESPGEVAVAIIRQFVPHKAINADNLKLLTAVLQVIAEVAVNSGPPLAWSREHAFHLPVIRPETDLGSDQPWAD
jgi:hypothetical protein